MVHALRSRRVVTPQGELNAAVLIDGERIVAVLPPAQLDPDIPVEDLGTLALLPGLIDAHTHINEPGRTEWEGFATATRAAAAGGFTTLIDMPLNCLPETTTVSALELKRAAASTGGPGGTPQCLVDYALWGGCVDGNQQHLEPLARAGVPGFKSFLIYPGCDGFTAIDRANLERALPHIARTGLPLLVHAELDPSINAAVAQLNASGADWRRYDTYLASRPDQAELEAIAMLIELVRQYRFRLHVVHLSTAQALPMLAAARREGLPISVETCPHFLHCCAEEIPDGATLFKSAPAIRSRANREQLWQALKDGLIDLIATDHSPCPPELKRLAANHPGEEAGRFDQAWGGITSLSTAISVLWTQAHTRGCTLTQLAQWTSTAPARLTGLSERMGSIEAGKHANLVAFDPDAHITVAPELLHYRHTISPYMGERLLGVVRKTWLRGEPVFTRSGDAPRFTDTFAVTPRGREHTVSCSLPDRDTLADWNALDATDAAEAILPCNGSRAWADGMAALRPFATRFDLTCSADLVWKSLSSADWQQAFDSHPRIGERHAKAATDTSLKWSAGEQAAAQLTDEIQQQLAAANREYDAKFSRIFIVCASGKTAAEMLAILRKRLANDPATELREAAEQQRQITQIRLRKWLSGS